MKVLAQPLVLHRIPAHADTQAHLPPTQHIHFCRLFGNEYRLPLREDDDPCNQFQMCQCRKVTKEHKRLVEHILVCIPLPAWSMRGISTQHMIKRKDVSITHSFYVLCQIANTRRVRTDLLLWENDSYLHIQSPSHLLQTSYSFDDSMHYRPRPSNPRVKGTIKLAETGEDKKKKGHATFLFFVFSILLLSRPC